MIVEIGKLEIDPTRLPLDSEGGNPYYHSPHLFVVQNLKDDAGELRLRIYVCLDTFHPGVQRNFHLERKTISGGGSCYTDSKKELVVGSHSGTYGTVDPAYRAQFAALIADVL